MLKNYGVRSIMCVLSIDVSEQAQRLKACSVGAAGTSAAVATATPDDY
jgi:hypothetical protein